MFISAKIIGILCISSASICIAQPLKSYGIKGGLSYSTQSWEPQSTLGFAPTYRTGIAAGFFLEGFNVSQLSMLAELWYVEKGFQQPGGVNITHPSLVYVSMPILLKYHIDTESFEPYFFGGPSIDYLFHISSAGLLSVTEAHSEGDSDIGFVVGAGIRYSIPYIKNLLAEIRFNPSIITTYQSNTLTVRNSSFQFLLGIGR